MGTKRNWIWKFDQQTTAAENRDYEGTTKRQFLAAIVNRAHQREPLAAGKETPFKAAVTNDLLKLIKRDIVFDLKQRIGEEKFKRESVRVKVIAIANLTLQLERMREGVIEGGDGKLVRKANYDHEGRPRTLIYRESDPERVIHIIGQIQNLLRSLGSKDDD